METSINVTSDQQKRCNKPGIQMSESSTTQRLSRPSAGSRLGPLTVRGHLNRVVWRLILSPGLLLFSLLMYVCMPLDMYRKGLNYVLKRKISGTSKRTLDIVGVIICLIPFSVLFIIIAILIKLDSNGPILYTQTRIGRNRRKSSRRKLSVSIQSDRRDDDRRNSNLFGKPFTIYKFRTMRHDAETKCGPVWATINDPRITSIGRFLRYTHLDELPQLINILRGEMSFVGPRPERPFFINTLAEKIPQYLDRLNTKPGLTGLAQVNCPHDYSLESVKTKLRYDLDYCNKETLLIYFKILFTTIHKKLVGQL